ncbi:hypothetical protein ACRE_043130 [Hapsidospora chrysogenum ATCC 11550]|uniref:Uncharacterized protein n=1 Tax=Hapsidospora chrysogenum (strain ATCC 11550 / CBS 779.69 / DSM 880 / IAM 14645 / JCM 23072 / IMI 49137) TaxID=857340 RepID=A0A086T672_HAPC1|nr:hypothetical protein ACRE_043130 [Hapsidospora chrysogenum ATCC 11550]
MERACYDYAKQKIPAVLSERQFDCAEAVELNRWTNELMKRTSMMGGLDLSNTSIEDILRSVTNIRHTAVHRLRVSAKAIEQFLLDAETLSTLFGIKVHIDEISRLRRSFQASIEELERNKHFLQSRLDEALQKIADQRAELQRMEEIAVSNMIKEDHEYQVIAGKAIEDSITVSDRLENAFSTTVVTKREEMREGPNTARNDDSDSGGCSGIEEHCIGGWRHEFSD